MFCWNLWWIDGWLAGNNPLLSTMSLHHPTGVSLKYHTLSPANGVIASPITRFSGPVTAHNFLLILHSFLTAFFVYLLSRQLQIPVWASLVASAIFTWWPARMVHASCHLNLASTSWMVLTILAFIKANRLGSRFWLGLTLLAFVLTGASSWHLFQQLCLLLPLCLFDTPLDTKSLKTRLFRLLFVTTAGLLLLAPLITPFMKRDTDYAPIATEEKQKFSIPWSQMIIPPVTHSIYGDLQQTATPDYPGVENTGFIGFGIMILMMIGLVRGTAREKLLILAGILFALLSLGPAISIGSFTIPMPLSLLDSLPMMGFSRTPGRFLISAGLLWSLSCGSRLAALSYRRKIYLTLILLLLILDFVPSGIGLTNTGDMRVYHHPAIRESEGILEIPNDWSNSAYMLGQTIHHTPISTGFSARLPLTVYNRIRGIPGLSDLSDPARAAAALGKMTPLDMFRLRELLAVDTFIFHSRFCEPPFAPDPLYASHLDPLIVSSPDNPEYPDYIFDTTDLDESLPGPEIYLLDRWSGPEDWKDGHGAVFWGLYPAAILRVIGAEEPVTVTFEALAAKQEDDQPVRFEVLSNRVLINTLELHSKNGWQEISFSFDPAQSSTIPAQGPPLPYSEISLEFSSGCSPAPSMDSTQIDNIDHRLLSLAIRSLEIKNTDTRNLLH